MEILAVFRNLFLSLLCLNGGDSLGSLGLCRLLCRGGGLGGEENGHTASLKLGGLVEIGNLGALGGKLLQKHLAYLGMCHLTAAETHRNLDSVAIGKELLGILELGVKIVGIDAGRHADLLYLDDTLVLLGFLLLLGLLKAELAVVHDAADRGIGARSDLDQIKVLFNCNFESFLSRHDAKLFSLTADQANFLVKNLFVDLMNSVCDCKHLRKTKNRECPASARKNTVHPLWGPVSLLTTTDQNVAG